MWMSQATEHASCEMFFFFNDTATTEIYTLSLHDALPISELEIQRELSALAGKNHPLNSGPSFLGAGSYHHFIPAIVKALMRSEEHTSELQSRQYLVCRLLLEKKK